MKKVELLSPAGSFEALQAAVQCGCDAVYLGGTMFGARAFAHNFDEKEMREAIAYAHVYGVRVFVTVNTLIHEEEIDAVMSYIAFLQDADADALIIQDLGLFSLVHQRFPDFELHASTQMHIHNVQGIRLLQEAGAARVVLPRETSIEQVRMYAKEGMDLEVFVQGALCVSYSGQCLMSSMTLSRSGNRGACAQSCRMQYALEKEENGKRMIVSQKGKYLLSPKDLNTLAHVPELIEAGIASFKIEGRMKRSEYVALMTSLYRQAIDAYYEGKDFHVDQIMEENMKKIFNRGFTAGHLYHQMGSNLMNFMRPNHMGIPIGVIEKVNRDRMTVRLSADLHQGDGIRILKKQEDEGFRVNRIYKNGRLVNHAKAKECIELDKTAYVEKGSILVKTSDVLQLKELEDSYQKNPRKVPLTGYFEMIKGEYPKFVVQDMQGRQVEVIGEVLCEKAMKTPLTQDRIKAQLSKSGDTPFKFSDIVVNGEEDGIFPVKEVNRMRREALSKLERMRKVHYSHRRIQDIVNTCSCKSMHISDIAVVHTYEQFLACKEAKMDMIFVEGKALCQKLKAQKEVFYVRQPRVMKETYQDTMEMIQENGGMYDDRSVIADTSLNVTNMHSAAFLFAHHVNALCLSLELSVEEYGKIAEDFAAYYHQKGNFIAPVYGHVELMLSEYCPINACLKDNDKKACGLCRKANYALIDLKKHRYPIMSDAYCRMHLLSEKPMNRMESISYLKEHGIQGFLYVFTIESKTEVLQVLKERR